MEPSTEKQKKWFAGKQANWGQFWRRLGYDGPPALAGKRLLDVGSGLGGNTAAAARSGANVVSLEPDLEILTGARSLLASDLEGATGKVAFVHGSIESYSDSDGFDYILCDEVFEHLLNFSSALTSMSKLLRPDGKLVSGWGPLWHSPVGGHQLMLYFAIGGKRRIPRMTLKSLSAGSTRRQILPYSHRFFTNYAMRLYRESLHLRNTDSIQQMGMNGYTVRQFKTLIDESPLDIVEWQENQGDHTAYKALRLLSKLPGGENLFTSNVYGVFALPRK